MNYNTRHTPWSITAASLFLLWGLLHLGLGLSMVAAGILDGPPAGELAAESLMFFVCAVVFGGQAAVVALFMNRANSRRGYWLNVLPLGVVDAAFVVILAVPGHVDLIGGLSGPAIWLLASTAATVAQRREARTP